MKEMLLLLAIIIAAVGAIDPDHVRFVDYSPRTGNFLFRTGDPSNATSGIAYDEWVALMARRAREAGHAFPPKFRLVDLSFWTGETEAIKAEVDFFARRPDLGEVHRWPINGVEDPEVFAACAKWGIRRCRTRQPADFAPEDYATLARHFPEWDMATGHGDQLSTRLQTAYSWLTARKEAVPLVIVGTLLSTPDFEPCANPCQPATRNLHWTLANALSPERCLQS